MANRAKFSEFKRLKIYKKYDGHCAYCKGYVDVTFFTIDHIIPLAKGGSNLYENLALACMRCNFKKSDKIVKK